MPLKLGYRVHRAEGPLHFDNSATHIFKLPNSTSHQLCLIEARLAVEEVASEEAGEGEASVREEVRLSRAQLAKHHS